MLFMKILTTKIVMYLLSKKVIYFPQFNNFLFSINIKKLLENWKEQAYTIRPHSYAYLSGGQWSRPIMGLQIPNSKHA